MRVPASTATAATSPTATATPTRARSPVSTGRLSSPLTSAIVADRARARESAAAGGAPPQEPGRGSGLARLGLLRGAVARSAFGQRVLVRALVVAPEVV